MSDLNTYDDYNNKAKAAAQTKNINATKINAAQSTATVGINESFFIEFVDQNNIKNYANLSYNGLILRTEEPQSGSLNEEIIDIKDIIGAKCVSSNILKKHSLCSSHIERNANQPNADTEVDNIVYLSIYSYVKSEIFQIRERKVHILQFNTFTKFEENLTAARHWQQAIKTYKYGLNGNFKQKSLLIFLNPKAGTGKGRKMFQKFIEPILIEADIHFDLQITTHANFARDFVRQKPDLLKFYCGIVVASGDGLFFEVLNGLMERLDADEICTKLPLGIIPCGSGNGLAKSIAHLHNEAYEPNPILYATLNCVSGKTSPMDIVFVESSNGQRVIKFHSFLSIGWGLIADIDIESEFLRLLGSQRFTIWAIRRLISLRRYKGKLSYIPHKNNEQKINYKNNDIVMPPLDKQLPKDGIWHTEEGEYIMVMAVYTTHLSSACFFAPNAQLNDGIIYLVIIRATISRLELLQFLINMDSGTHLPQEPHENIEVVPVHAFRIEPAAENGIIAVDGERIDFGPIQAVIKPALINVMVPP